MDSPALWSSNGPVVIYTGDQIHRGLSTQQGDPLQPLPERWNSISSTDRATSASSEFHPEIVNQARVVNQLSEVRPPTRSQVLRDQVPNRAAS